MDELYEDEKGCTIEVCIDNYARTIMERLAAEYPDFVEYDEGRMQLICKNVD